VFVMLMLLQSLHHTCQVPPCAYTNVGLSTASPIDDSLRRLQWPRRALPEHVRLPAKRNRQAFHHLPPLSLAWPGRTIGPVTVIASLPNLQGSFTCSVMVRSPILGRGVSGCPTGPVAIWDRRGPDQQQSPLTCGLTLQEHGQKQVTRASGP